LREFVYLDEVSVFSLIASRLGPIATEFTENERASLKAEVGGAGGSLEAGSQVLRKSTVQTTFKELYEIERDSLALRPIEHHVMLPRIKDIQEAIRMKDVLGADGLIVDPEELSRGTLIEVEVQLEASDIFRVSSVLSTILEIIDENPAMFGVETANFAQGKAAGRVLDKLLVGLVPVSGVAVDYEVVVVDNKEWIIHQELLSSLSGAGSLQTFPLHVVGVAEQSLFWKDVRRALFSNARYRVFCRLAQDNLTKSWTPVKLAHILDLVKPGLGDQLDSLGSVVLATMISAGASEPTDDRRQFIRDALTTYAKSLSEHYKIPVTTDELMVSGIPSEAACDNFDTVEARRQAFTEVSTFLKERSPTDFDPVVVARYRSDAILQAGLDLLGRPMSSKTAPATPLPGKEKRFLDSEFVGIYW